MHAGFGDMAESSGFFFHPGFPGGYIFGTHHFDDFVYVKGKKVAIRFNIKDKSINLQN